ncbi:MAG: hypothetical protein Kow0010_15210 [Dehalococcoidia bacterium]
MIQRALVALAPIVVVLAAACAGSGDDALGRLRDVAPYREGVPALVFVYTDG